MYNIRLRKTKMRLDRKLYTNITFIGTLRFYHRTRLFPHLNECQNLLFHSILYGNKRIDLIFLLYVWRGRFSKSKGFKSQKLTLCRVNFKFTVDLEKCIGTSLTSSLFTTMRSMIIMTLINSWGTLTSFDWTIEPFIPF